MRYAYAYYRIDPAQAELAASRIDTLLVTMAAHCSQPPRRLVRCEDPETWMEVYAGIADTEAFSAALNAAVEDLRCCDFTREERHLECFVSSASSMIRASNMPPEASYFIRPDQQ